MFKINLSNKLGDSLNHNLLENYFVSARGSLTRDKVNLALTVFGLAIGLAASFLIALYAINESTYDAFQPNAHHTYRLVMHSQNANEYALSTPRAYQTINQLSGVEDAALLISANWISDNRIKIANQYVKLRQSYSATANIADFIALDVIQGDLTTALTQPDKIALSKSEALRLFGTQNAVGQSFISTASNKTWMVSAVFADMPDNSHFAFNSLVSSQPYQEIRGNIAHYYLRMAPNSEIEKTEKAVNQIFVDIWQWQNTRYQLQPLLAIHLAKNYSTDMKVGGAQKNVSISIVLSILLLLISSFNTINMSVAQAGSRAKEVGVRKALGASKLQLLLQFLTESVALTFIAALIGAVIVELVLPQFNQLVGRQLSVGNWSEYIAQIVEITFLIGVTCGLYPALFIASFSTKRVLAGDFQRGKSAIIIRKSLMVLQSAFSIALIIGAINLSLQLHHLQNLPVNYEKQQRLMVVDAPTDKVFAAQSQTFYQALTQLEGVVSATPTDFDLTDRSNAGFFIDSITGVESVELHLSHGGVGFNAVQTLGLQLVAGRDFSNQHPADWYNHKMGFRPLSFQSQC
jgi:putative ABC transport system permease protein